MIIGIGIDVVEIIRLRQALEDGKTGQRFRYRVFSLAEQKYCDRRREKYESYAARFAAKEATMKALGTGAGWREIEIVRREGRPPHVLLHGRAKAHAQSLGVKRLHLAVTHAVGLAIAQVIAEG